MEYILNIKSTKGEHWMNDFFYLLFGFLDILVLLVLTFKIFRWPIRSFLSEIAIIAIVCSAESYIMRMIFNVSQFDLLIQITSVFILIKFLMKVNLYHSLSLSAVGALSYSEVVFIVYRTLDKLNIISPEDAAANSGIGIYTLQAYAEFCGLLVALFLYTFNFGFSFISIPPHDRKVKYSTDEKLNVSFLFISIVIVISTTFWVVTYGGFGMNVMIISELIALLLVLYLARRKEYSI